MVFKRLEVLSKSDLTRVHEASLKILEETGVVFHGEKALEIFKQHGAKVSNKTVYFSRKMVEDALKTCPSTFKWQAINDEHSVTFGEGCLVQPNVGPVYIQDMDNGRRKATLEDYANITKLAQASNVIHFVGGTPVDPSDVKSEEKHLHIMYETLKNSTKPLIGVTDYTKQVRQQFDMVKMAFGKEDILENNHCIGVAVNPLSPLAYSPDAVDTIIEYATYKQPIFIPAAIMAGVSGPISLFGTVIQQNVEILAGLVLAQLVNPGAPVVYTLASNAAYMKRASFTLGSPESMLMHIAGLQMGNDYYQLPTRSLAGTTESKTIDCQAGYETMQNLMMGMLGGANMIVECIGVLDSIMTTSYEKFIIDLEVIERINRIAKGIDTSDAEAAISAIQEVGSGGSFLMHPNTFAHFKDRWLPTVSDWESYEDWEKAGSEDVVVRANRKFKEILQNAPETLLDSELDKELQAYISKTKF